jgi:hypothetical protein
MTNARSPFRVALVGLAPFVRQRILHLGDAASRPRWSGLRPEPVSRLGHTATIGIAVSLFCVAYFAWQFAR